MYSTSANIIINSLIIIFSYTLLVNSRGKYKIKKQTDTLGRESVCFNLNYMGFKCMNFMEINILCGCLSCYKYIIYDFINIIPFINLTNKNLILHLCNRF